MWTLPSIDALDARVFGHRPSENFRRCLTVSELPVVGADSAKESLGRLNLSGVLRV